MLIQESEEDDKSGFLFHLRSGVVISFLGFERVLLCLHQSDVFDGHYYALFT